MGVSRDSVESHRNFKAQHSLPYTLIADTEGALYEAFGADRRSTFLIDSTGKILKTWPQVSVEGHAADVLRSI